MTLSPSLSFVLGMLQLALKGTKAEWFIGGSCGLLLQKVAISTDPRDIDVYIDPGSERLIHECLHEYSMDIPIFSETGMYQSILSHYDIGGVIVELVCGFTVRSDEVQYRVYINHLIRNCSSWINRNDTGINLMPLAHELMFNVLRGRPDRYIPIAEAMRINLDLHLPVLDELIRNNKMTTSFIHILSNLIQYPLDERENGYAT